jgi:DnaJ-class molecular chaperone
MAKNLYDSLGLKRDASDKEVRSAYRKLARKYHPDVTPNDRAAEARFKEVTAAYEVISDPEKRKKYDKYGDRWEHADQIEEAQQRQSAAGWARAGGSPGGNSGGEAFGDFGSIFENIFRRERGGPRGQPSSRRGQDVETPVEVSLEEAFAGTARTVRLQSVEPCRTCGGTGEVAGAICHSCEGAGQAARERRLEVKAPPGVKTGSRVRIGGEGRPGLGGGPPGDLYLLVTVLPHVRFERRGDDLFVDVDVPLTGAVLGGEVHLTTIDGRVALRIPELTQNGRQIRLAGKGMPVLGPGGGRGDLIARVRVQLPEQLSDEERQHFEALRRLQAPAAARP